MQVSARQLAHSATGRDACYFRYISSCNYSVATCLFELAPNSSSSEQSATYDYMLIRNMMHNCDLEETTRCSAKLLQIVDRTISLI